MMRANHCSFPKANPMTLQARARQRSPSPLTFTAYQHAALAVVVRQPASRILESMPAWKPAAPTWSLTHVSWAIKSPPMIAPAAAPVMCTPCMCSLARCWSMKPQGLRPMRCGVLGSTYC